MSWDVYLEMGGVPVEVENHQEGGTQVVGGTTEAWLNVTYNYSGSFFQAGIEKFDALSGKTAQETIPILREAVEKLGVERDPDYWAPTDGNAGYALSILLKWAEQYPFASWRIC